MRLGRSRVPAPTGWAGLVWAGRAVYLCDEHDASPGRHPAQNPCSAAGGFTIVGVTYMTIWHTTIARFASYPPFWVCLHTAHEIDGNRERQARFSRGRHQRLLWSACRQLRAWVGSADPARRGDPSMWRSPCPAGGPFGWRAMNQR